MFKSKYQKLMDIEAERILQLKREKSELKLIADEAVKQINNIKSGRSNFPKWRLEFLQPACDRCKQKIKKIDDYLESRFDHG